MSVVVEHRGDLYALLVDQVAEVMPLTEDTFEPNPPTLPKARAGCSCGIHRLDGALVMVLDVARLLEPEGGAFDPSEPARAGDGARGR